MKRSKTFVAVSSATVLAGALATRTFLNADASSAVLVAGLTVLVTQLPLHFLLRTWRERNDRFMAAIVVGFVVRVGVLAGGVVLFVIPGRTVAAPFLLALGGFLVAVLIAESVLESGRLRSVPKEGAEAAAS